MSTLSTILLWPSRFALASRAQICVDLSRLLLGLAFIELLTMPLTQSLWTWDGFLRGGQDFELGLFIIVSCLCLVLLRAQHTRQRVRLLLALRSLVVLLFRPTLRRILPAMAHLQVAPDDLPRLPLPPGSALPLRI